MNERTRIIIAIILLIILLGAITYSVRSSKQKTAPVTLTPVEQVSIMNDATVRASRSYRLEDNLSVPSERVIEEEQ